MTNRANIFTSDRDLSEFLFCFVFSYEKHQPILFLTNKININTDLSLVTGSRKCEQMISGYFYKDFSVYLSTVTYKQKDSSISQMYAFLNFRSRIKYGTTSIECERDNMDYQMHVSS